MHAKHKKVRVIVRSKQTLEDLLEENKGYVEFLRRSQGAESAARYIEYLKKLASELPEPGTLIERDMIEMTPD